MARLTINNILKKNILTLRCLDEMKSALEDLSRDSVLRVLIITGSGSEAFCAGFDIQALPGSKEDVSLFRQEIPPLEGILSLVEAFPAPVIAMLNGYAYGGGCELAVSCDIRVAAKSTKMAMTATRLGLVYPPQGLKRFLIKLGFSTTLEMFLTAKTYGSHECLQKGLVNFVVEDHHLQEFTHDLAEQIASNAPLALGGTKRAIYAMARDLSIDASSAKELECLFMESLLSQEHLERKKAFLERRKEASSENGQGNSDKKE